MKVLILAGGIGTRLSEETMVKPKPMVEIGGKPILWHIMKIYSYYGYNSFVIALGYKGNYIKQWFSNYFLNNSDVTIDIKNNKIEVHKNDIENWKISLVYTGIETQTGGRIKKIIEKGYIEDDEFMMTYGDGLSDINIKKLVDFHKSHSKLATIIAVQPENRFGALVLKGDKVISFGEKQDNKGRLINGGFMVLNKKIVENIDSYLTPFEREPLEKLTSLGELMSYKHDGFWYAMDTLNHKNILEKIWQTGKAPWKVY